MSENSNVRQELIQILDELLSKDYWDKTPFLVAASKRLKQLREELAEGHDIANEAIEEINNTRESLGTGYQGSHTREVYVALYQADGNNLKKWASLLNAISSHSISRPIYQNEQDIKKVLRSITAKQNHGYAVVKVREQDIVQVPDEQAPHDKLGHQLLLIRERAISKLNIVRFVHATGEYKYEKGQLIKVRDVSFHE